MVVAEVSKVSKDNLIVPYLPILMQILGITPYEIKLRIGPIAMGSLNFN